MCQCSFMDTFLITTRLDLITSAGIKGICYYCPGWFCLFLRFYLFICMNICLKILMCTTCVPGVKRPELGTDLLELELKLGVVVHLGGRGRRAEFEVSLVYKESSRRARAIIQRNPNFKNKNPQNKQTNKQPWSYMTVGHHWVWDLNSGPVQEC